MKVSRKSSVAASCGQDHGKLEKFDQSDPVYSKRVQCNIERKVADSLRVTTTISRCSVNGDIRSEEPFVKQITSNTSCFVKKDDAVRSKSRSDRLLKNNVHIFSKTTSSLPNIINKVKRFPVTPGNCDSGFVRYFIALNFMVFRCFLYCILFVSLSLSLSTASNS